MFYNDFYKFNIQPYSWNTQSLNDNTDLNSLRDDFLSFLPYYMIYSSMVMNLTKIIFPQENEQLDTEFNELLLYYKGRSAVIRDKDKGLMLCDFVTINREFNMFGRPTAITPIDRHTGEHISDRITSDDFVIIESNKFWYPNNLTVLSFSKTLSNINNAVDNNINQQKFPIVFQGTKDQKLTFQELISKIQKDFPYIFLDKQINISDITKLMVDAHFISKEMLDVADRKKATMLELLGITNPNVIKQSGISEAETNSNNIVTALIGDTALRAKEKAVNELKTKFNLNCSLWINPILKQELSIESEDNDNESIHNFAE